jgi:predicted aconitase with swiveling domain
MRLRVRVRSLVEGEARGPLLELEEPISFWGGVDPGTGRIVERGHPQHGLTVTGTILSLPHGRGSSSASSVLAEMIRSGTAPAAMVLASPDPILVLGAVVADELYGQRMPVVERLEDWDRQPPAGTVVHLAGNGWVEIH